ncbi:hypothetical protein D3C72_1093020 [compost metagenome]
MHSYLKSRCILLLILIRTALLLLFSILLVILKSRFIDFFTTDGEKPDRDRDREFEELHLTKIELLKIWEDGRSILFELLDNLSEEDLLKTVHIRTEPYTVLGALNRQINHYGYHTGQIVQLGKMIRKINWQ